MQKHSGKKYMFCSSQSPKCFLSIMGYLLQPRVNVRVREWLYFYDLSNADLILHALKNCKRFEVFPNTSRVRSYLKKYYTALFLTSTLRLSDIVLIIPAKRVRLGCRRGDAQ